MDLGAFCLKSNIFIDRNSNLKMKETANKMISKFMDLPVKDRISYYVAFALIGSGILIAFLSFFLNAYSIATSILIYIAQCFVIGGGLVGANVYFRSKWVEFDTRAKKEIMDEVDRLAQRLNKE